MTNEANIANDATAAPNRRNASWWLAPLVAAAFGVTLTLWVWGRTGELLLDFSRELYISWQIAQGKLLYLDLDYRFGPLVVCANGMWMRLFGPALQTVLVANLLVLVAMCVLLYRLMLKMSDPFTASVGIIFFLSVFGLGTGTMLAQYNFLTPYNHGATYGLMLSLAALLCVWRYCQTGRMRDAAAAGFFTGLCFLTKPEMFLACAVATTGGLTAAIFAFRYRIGPAILASAVAAVVPPVIAFAAFARCMPWRTALAGTLGGWQFVSNSNLVGAPFYRWCMGTDHFRLNVILMLASAAAWAAGIAILALIAGVVRNQRRVALYLAASLACAIATFLLLDEKHSPDIRGNIERGLPLVMAGAAGAWVWRVWRLRGQQLMPCDVLRVSFALLSLVLLFKILFYARTSHYGFVLAAPAGMTVVVILLHEVPSRLGSSGRSAGFFRCVAMGLLGGMAACRLVTTHLVLDARDKAAAHLALGGTLPLLERDAGAAPAITELVQLIPPHGTLVVFPDSAGLNYATARASSIPFTVFNPFELQMTGEDTVIQSLQHSPPDFVVIVSIDESEYGAKTFGVDYGVAIQNWIDRNYTLGSTKPEPGAEPEVRKISILRRR